MIVSVDRIRVALYGCPIIGVDKDAPGTEPGAVVGWCYQHLPDVVAASGKGAALGEFYPGRWTKQTLLLPAHHHATARALPARMDAKHMAVDLRRPGTKADTGHWSWNPRRASRPRTSIPAAKDSAELDHRERPGLATRDAWMRGHEGAEYRPGAIPGRPAGGRKAGKGRPAGRAGLWGE